MAAQTATMTATYKPTRTSDAPIHGARLVAMAPQYSFSTACTRLQINDSRERFHSYILLRGYEPGQTYSLDTWRGWLEMFDAWDTRNTQQDALS